MSIFTEFRSVVNAALGQLTAAGSLPSDLDTKNVAVEPPRDASHGDIATNAAMVLSKQAKMKPRDIADMLAPLLEKHESVDSVDVAGPGFINLALSPVFWAVFGDALANLLEKAGYNVTKEYLINDAGGQIDVLARSVYLRYQEAHGLDIGAIPEGLYPGDYLVPVGVALKEKYGNKWLDADESEWLEVIRLESVDAMMAMIKEDLRVLGVSHEVFFSENTLHNSGRIDDVVKTLTDKGYMYKGVLEPPKGKKPDDWEEREQTLFKATDFGDDIDRALQKSNGDYTYFGADIAYHFDKISRGFKDMINVWGADHGGYVKRMKAAVKALDNEADLDIKLCQLVKLYRDGEPVKMSKRAGTFVTLREVVDEVGRDVIRFIMLTRKNDAPLDFDFAKVMEQSKDNPVFYVQYAHAREYSVRNVKAKEAFPGIETTDSALANADLSLLTAPSELAVLKQCCQWPRLIEAAADSHEPHRIAFYLYDLASEFHAWYHTGRDDPALRMVVDDEAITKARLALARVVAIVIASGLEILGVTPVNEMR